MEDSKIRKSQNGKNMSSAPYQGSEMRYAMNCSQGKLGIGVASPVKPKMPEYGVAYKVLSVKNGAPDVKGGKI